MPTLIDKFQGSVAESMQQLILAIAYLEIGDRQISAAPGDASVALTLAPDVTTEPLYLRELLPHSPAVAEGDACPFANLPEKKRTMWALTKEEMKNCVWLKPELIAQIEFTEWTRDGHLRHSKFVGLRKDKDAREV